MAAVRFLLRAVGVLLAAALVVCVAVLGHGWWLANGHVRRALQPIVVHADSAGVSRGGHLALELCAGCHSQNLRPPLSGGTENLFDIANGPHFGTLVAPNITPGGRLAAYSDAEIARVLREGISREGRPLLVMPSRGLHALSDRDLGAVIAFLRSQPAVRHEVPARAPNLLAYLVLGLHVFSNSVMPAVTSPVPDVPAAPSVAYGRYLTTIIDCETCHGPDLRGGHQGQLPPIGPDIVALASTHGRDAFDLALRQGVSMKDGHALDPRTMPFATFSYMDSTEVSAIHAYLAAGAPR